MTKKQGNVATWQFDAEKSLLIVLGASEQQLKSACSRPYAMLVDKLIDAITTALLFHKTVWIVKALAGVLPDRIAAMSVPVLTLEREPAIILESKELRKKIQKAGFTNLFFAGTRMDVSVIHNALAAQKMGFVAVVIIDACSTDSELAEQAAIMKLASCGVAITTAGALGLELY